MAPQKRLEIKRKDWDVVLDQLYKRCIAPTARGIGIISNTSRENSGDVEGELQEELTYRVKEREQGNLTYKMSLLSIEILTGYHLRSYIPVVTHMGSKEPSIAILMIPVKTDRFFLTFIQRLEQHFDERFRLGV